MLDVLWHCPFEQDCSLAYLAYFPLECSRFPRCRSELIAIDYPPMHADPAAKSFQRHSSLLRGSPPQDEGGPGEAVRRAAMLATAPSSCCRHRAVRARPASRLRSAREVRVAVYAIPEESQKIAFARRIARSYREVSSPSLHPETAAGASAPQSSVLGLPFSLSRAALAVRTLLLFRTFHFPFQLNRIISKPLARIAEALGDGD